MSNKNDLAKSQRQTGVWVAMGLLILIFGFTVALTWPAYVDRANPFWFVGMLVIFSGALCLVAVVFNWMGVANKEEAFSLPSGSVRALLAIGVMVLFAVFGLGSLDTGKLGGIKRVSDNVIATAVAPSSAPLLTAEIKRYQDDGMAVVVEKVEGSTATLRLYRVDQSRPADMVDTQKQVITALVTLLTSIISFYFGSRSVEAALDRAKEPFTDTALPATVTFESDLAQLDRDIATSKERVSALQSEAAALDDEKAFAETEAFLELEGAAIAADRSRLEVKLSGLRAVGTAPGQEIVTELGILRNRTTAYIKRLFDAEKLVAKG